jgi:hypothetical protein
MCNMRREPSSLLHVLIWLMYYVFFNFPQILREMILLNLVLWIVESGKQDLNTKSKTKVQGAIIRVLTYRRNANITVWYFFVFSHVPRRYAKLLLSAHLFFAGITWPIQYRNLVGDVLAWNMIALMALRNVGVGCLK